jgi:hypothetical protein
MNFLQKIPLSISILAVIILATTDYADAQRRRSSRGNYGSSSPVYGVNGGVTISNIDPQNGSTAAGKLGYYVGGFFEYKFSDKMGLQADANFIEFGAQEIPTNLIFSTSSAILNNVKSVDLSIYGVDVPLSLKYHFTDVYPEFYICAGLSGTYILKAQAALNKEVSVAGGQSRSTAYVDVTPKVQDMQGTALIGGGASIPFKSIYVQVNISFHYGITDLSANNVAANNGFSSKYLKLGVGISF